MAGPQVPSVGIRPSQILTVFRIGSAGLLLGPGVGKFLTYRRSVAFFSAIGLPAPEALVVVVGTVELVAAGLLLSNRRPRFGASLAVPVMVVAAFTAGPTWQNLGLLGMALGIIGFETTLGTGDADGSTG